MSYSVFQIPAKCFFSGDPGSSGRKWLQKRRITPTCSGERYDRSVSMAFRSDRLRKSVRASIRYLSTESKSASSMSPQKKKLSNVSVWYPE